MNNLANPKETEDGTGIQGMRKRVGSNEYVMVYVGESKSKGEFQVIEYDGDEDTNPKVADASTSSAYQEVGVILDDISDSGFYWVQVEGKAEALVDGDTDVSKDDFLEVLDGSVNAIKDDTTRSENSVAVACEAQTANEGTLTDVWLLGGRAQIAAS